MNTSRKHWVTRIPLTDFFYLLLCNVYGALVVFQLHLRPLHRYSGWDHFWGDVRTAGMLESIRNALIHLEIPAIDPATGFGWNFAGDHHPFWALPNILSGVLSPGQIIFFVQILAFCVGSTGAYFFLKRITRNNVLSFIGGISYISIPFVISLSYFYYAAWSFYLIPHFLICIHRFLEQPTRRNLLLFLLLSVWSFSLCDIHFLIIITVTISAYTLLTGVGFYRIPLFSSLKKSVVLTALCLLAGSFYIIPLLSNIHEIGSAVESFKRAGIIPTDYQGVEINFLQIFQRIKGVESLYMPIEGSALTLYIPAFSYLAILLSFLFSNAVFRKNPRQLMTVFTLVLIGAFMFIGSVVFYSPITAAVLPGLREGARGVLRYHLNLIPFVNLLAAMICLSAMNDLPHWKLRMGLFAVCLLTSLLIDIHLLYDRYLVLERPFGCANLFRIYSDNPLNLVPPLNSCVILFIFASRLPSRFSMPIIQKGVLFLLIIIASSLSLATISNYHEWFATGQQGRQPPLSRNPYRWESYQDRKTCIDALIDRYDPNYRTLYVGKGRSVDYDGRDRMLIAETELHVAEREKALFSYREFSHPYTGLMRGTFKAGGNGFYRSNIMPPLSREVPGNIAAMKLMGVKWVISAAEDMHHPDLLYRGSCFTPAGPMERLGKYEEGGNMFIYELLHPTGITFLADWYEMVSQQDALNIIFTKKEYPWERGIVLLEKDPTQNNLFPSGRGPQTETSDNSKGVYITRETFNLVEMSVNAPEGKYLVLSYLFRPGWKAYVDTKKVQVYRAYGGFMSVQVPSGNHSITFKYVPRDVYLGLFLTFVVLALPIFAWKLVQRQLSLGVNP